MAAVRTIFREIGSVPQRRSGRIHRTPVRRTGTPRSGFDGLFLKLAAAALRLEKARRR